MAVDLSRSIVPQLATVVEHKRETPSVASLLFRFQDEEAGRAFVNRPGQFLELSVFGAGESTFAVTSLPNPEGLIGVSVKNVGQVTRAVHGLRAGDTAGLRGPYGNHFPLEDWRGRDLLVIGGGIGLAPLRPLVNYVLANRKEYGRLQILYGAIAPGELLYHDDREIWRQAPATEVIETVDAPAAGWGGRTGLVPAVLKELAPKPKDKIAVTCGPPIMIRYALAALKELGFPDEAVYTTLEMKMQCGLGKCGRCNIGGKYVCRDGPVFSAAELARLPKEY